MMPIFGCAFIVADLRRKERKAKRLHFFVPGVDFTNQLRMKFLVKNKFVNLT
jgi:hypothetical protein